MLIKPQQRLPKSKKTAEWVKQNVLYYRTEAKPILDDKKATSRYNVAYGVLDEGEYLYITNPKNTNRKELMGYPTKLRNIPIGPPIFSVLMGEKSKRFIDYQVIAVNSDVENLKLAKETQLVLTSMQNEFYNMMNPDEMNMVRTPEQIKKEVSSIIDDIAIMGQDAVDYMRWYNDLDRKFKELFFDAICQNCFVSERAIANDEVHFDVISPKEISIVAGRNLTFIEDSEAVVRRTKMSLTEIYDEFQHFDDFNKVLKDKLDARLENSTQGELATPNRISGHTEIDIRYSNYWNRESAAKLFENLNLNRRGENFENGEYYDVEHIVWDTFTKVGIIFDFDPYEGWVEREVSEEYIPMEGEEVLWEWRKEVYHAYCVNQEYVIGGEPLPGTKAPANAPNKAKKPYNGRLLDGISISDLVLPYQAKHNIYNYYAEKLVGKHRGDIILLPIGLMPDGNNDAGIDFETSLHYADADGFLLIDDSDKDKIHALQYMKVLNSSLDQTLSQIMSLAEANVAELEGVIGINRFRKGQQNSSDGKFVSQQAEYRGSMMSEHLFTQIDEVHTKDLQFCLDLSQIAWVRGKKAHFLSSAFKDRFLEINPERYSTAMYGIGLNNNARATEKLNLMKAYTQALAQDPNVPKNVIPRLIDADNMAGLISEMDKLMAEHEKRMQEQGEAEHLRELEMAKADLEKLQKTIDFQYYKTDTDNATKRYVGELQRSKNGEEANREVFTDPLEVYRADAERRTMESIENKKLQITREIALIKDKTERYKADKAFDVAKINKNPK